MKLVLNTPGTHLAKRGECFYIINKENKREISSRKVDQILITTHTSLTVDAIELAIENNIDIVFLKNEGKPLARVWHSKLGSITTIRRNQLKLNENSLGIYFVKDWIGSKLLNQINFLKKLGKNRDTKKNKLIKNSIQKIEEMKLKIISMDEKSSVEEMRSSILGYEGNSSRVYFNSLGQLIPEKYKFNGRSRNPAKDYFNCFLNYSYGILYSSVERACIIAGLDPYIGIMHTDNYNKTALVYDLVEQYRGYMDELVFRLFSTKKVTDKCCNNIEGGYYLNREGKQILINDYNIELEKRIKYKGKNIEFENIIQFDCHNIANKILKEM